MEKENKNLKRHKIIYFEDELNDDFAGTNIKTKTISKKYKFIKKNIIFRIFSFLLYYVIAVPVFLFYCYAMKHVKVVINRKAIRKVRKQNKNGIFLYGNHTGILDVFTPYLLSLPKRNKVLASTDAISIKGVSGLVQMLGGIPVPNNDIAMLKKLTESIEYYNKKGFNISIYPEAHIWPYYTGIRNFKDSSFGYPVKLGSPVVAFFTAYSEPKKKSKKPKTTIYVSDPIYPDLNKPKKQAQKELRDKVYEFMKDCSEKYSTYSYIEYKHISEKPENTQIDQIDQADFE